MNLMVCSLFDHCGHEVAIKMLRHSCRPGRYSDTYTQLDTSESYNPHSPTTVEHQQSQTDPRWPWAIRKESTSFSLLFRVPSSGFSDSWKEPATKWDKTGVQTMPSRWISYYFCWRPWNSGYRRRCVSEMKTDG
jgi:hypothetical protein